MKKKGILFWITGLSGSGKTTLAKKIVPFVEENYGISVHLDGDNLRNILNLKGYSFEDRMSYAEKFVKLAKLLTDNGVNVVFSVVGLMNKPRNWNKKNIKKYVEIYIKSDVRKIISFKRKKNIYKNRKNVVGTSIKPQFPKKPHIIINNTFDKNIKTLENELRQEIKILLKQKKYKN